MSYLVNQLVSGLVYKVMNSELRKWPYPHIVVEDWLPLDLWLDLASTWPEEKMAPIAEVRNLTSYKNRRCSRDQVDLGDHWDALTQAVMSAYFAEAMMDKFTIPASAMPHVHSDTLLIEDGPGYAIGPHTDSPAKILSMLAYFQDWENRKPRNDTLGTSIYWTPTGRTCVGGPHHNRDDPAWDFQEVYRVPYEPNTMVCFLKTDNSFHGVEPVPEGANRRVFLWNLRKRPKDARAVLPPEAAAST